MAYVPHIWTVDDYVNPENLNHMEQGIDARFQSFNLNGGSVAVTNGYYIGIIEGSGVNYRSRVALIRVNNANNMFVAYINTTTMQEEIEFTLSNGVLSTTGTNNGNVALIKLD